MMRRPFAILATCALAIFSLGQQSPAMSASTSAIVDSPAGKLQGTGEDGLSVFKGIPYALPPVGRRRWQSPVEMPRWSGTRDATRFGPGCVQPVSTLSSVYTSAETLPMSEDCLTLNIWAPKNATNAPVFFWIHGGALVTGSSREAMYDGQRLADRGVIVVSINYRLGVLGYMAHPALSAETAQKTSGNYGLLDQMMALYWVHKNIAAFGGNPHNVTIAGESAGALSVLYLMSSPLARGLFQKGIAESAYMLGMPELKKSVLGMPSGEAAGQMLQAGLGAADLAAMRGMDAQEITNKAAAGGFQPWGLVDGYILPQHMVTAFDQGKQAPVPVLIGFNQGEIRSLTVLAPKAPASPAEYESIIRDRYGELADAFLKLYPASDPKESILLTVRDGLYGWTAERVGRKQLAIGQPTYVYLFDHGYPAMDERGLHAFHASELPYVFGTFGSLGPNWPRMPDTPEEHALSDAMIDYWTSFAATGTPSAANAPAWPAFGTERAYMHFAATPQPATQLMPGMFELNEEVMCRRLAANATAWPWNIGVASAKVPPTAAGC